MTTHHLFFVHGMGSHSNNWVEDEGIKGLIKTLYESYDGLTELGNFDERIRCHSIFYNDIFDDQIKRWDDMVSNLRNGLTGSPSLLQGDIDTLLKLAEKPQSGIDDKKFFYTHVLDVLFYKFTLLNRPIIVQCAKQIFDKIRPHFQDGDTRYSIVGHSLGTSVAHGALQALYTEPEYQNLSKAIKFETVFQVSNTSYILSRNRDDHYRHVFPGKPSSNAVCKYLFNVSHTLDLFSELVPFDPPEDWPNANDRRRYIPIRISRVKERNIHDLAHYFSNPKVHVPFFRVLLGRFTIPKHRFDQAWKDYLQSTPEGKFKDLEEKLNSLKLTDRQSWVALMNTLKIFLNSLEEIR
jgi:hypothetical protein